MSGLYVYRGQNVALRFMVKPMAIATNWILGRILNVFYLRLRSASRTALVGTREISTKLLFGEQRRANRGKTVRPAPRALLNSSPSPRYLRQPVLSPTKDQLVSVSTPDDLRKKELILKRLVTQAFATTGLELEAAPAPVDPIPTTVTAAAPAPADAAKTPGDSGSGTQSSDASK
ncbi:hypothetical protein FRC00_009232 [Tulasnella sp. 408]|nr:hypothetical protein FRC00_009232 [Tulasnella sp. 408]